MNISIVCSSTDHPINPGLAHWAEKHGSEHSVEIVRSQEVLSGGDILFLVSCSELITAQTREKYAKTLVVHASDLPEGRGWSPYIWSILAGKTEIVVTLLEAAEKVDAGDIWQKVSIDIPVHALADEINEILFAAEFELMDYGVEHFADVSPQPQSEEGATYLEKRQPSDSELDVEKSIKEQFDLMRVSDPKRYPAYFELHGHTYAIHLEKIDGDQHNE
jgi:methionyl-tRNA formyltransferase